MVIYLQRWCHYLILSNCRLSFWFLRSLSDLRTRFFWGTKALRLSCPERLPRLSFGYLRLGIFLKKYTPNIMKRDTMITVFIGSPFYRNQYLATINNHNYKARNFRIAGPFLKSRPQITLQKVFPLILLGHREQCPVDGLPEPATLRQYHADIVPGHPHATLPVFYIPDWQRMLLTVAR